MKKTIIGIIGDKDARLNALCEHLGKHKFKKVTISSKVREMSKYIVRGDLSDDIVSQIRERGYKVNRLYWVNLLLSSMKDEDSNILIEDLSKQDIVDGVMTVYCSGNDPSMNGCVNISSWDEERLSKEISRILRMSRKTA